MLAFVFFGFLVAGDEIENPFGYDRNGLNMEHFIHIIRDDLHALISMPAFDIATWPFPQENDNILGVQREDIIKPAFSLEEWVKQGRAELAEPLASP
ncbi:hypothetical protein HWV62_7425 [Athelia sp. TMB]|nr:hypothetical protein HWV62_7425 [Athelia sp. TMB]